MSIDASTPLEKPKQRVTVRIPHAVWKFIKAQAAIEDCSASELVARVAEEYVGSQHARTLARWNA